MSSRKPTLELYAPKRAPSHRKERVGEEIRQVLSAIFLRGDLPTLELENISITVTRVSLSPDLKNCEAFVMPLAGSHQKEVMRHLRKLAPWIRHQLSQNIQLRAVPALKFTLDGTFEKEAELEALFRTLKDKESLDNSLLIEENPEDH